MPLVLLTGPPPGAIIIGVAAGKSYAEFDQGTDNPVLYEYIRGILVLSLCYRPQVLPGPNTNLTFLYLESI